MGTRTRCWSCMLYLMTGDTVQETRARHVILPSGLDEMLDWAEEVSAPLETKHVVIDFRDQRGVVARVEVFDGKVRDFYFGPRCFQ